MAAGFYLEFGFRRERSATEAESAGTAVGHSDDDAWKMPADDFGKFPVVEGWRPVIANARCWTPPPVDGASVAMSHCPNCISIGGRSLGSVRHICAFFHSKDEEHRTLSGFIKEGIEQNERAAHFVCAQGVEDHRGRLRASGIDVEGAEKRGQLRVSTWDDAYLKDGHFDQDRQIKFLEGVLEAGRRAGFAQTRLIANMEWALEDKAGVEDIVEYESRLNYTLPKYSDPVICTYDLSRFSAGVAMDILRTHPMVILGGVLQENPLYVPPDEFLHELNERRGAAGNS